MHNNELSNFVYNEFAFVGDATISTLWISKSALPLFEGIDYISVFN